MRLRKVSKARKVLLAATGLLTVGAAALFVIPGASAETTPVVVLTSDFEDGTAQGWAGRGDAAVAVTADAANSGANSLVTTGRTANWNGPARNVAGVLARGATYVLEASVRMAAGQPAAGINMTVQRTPDGGETAYEWVGGAGTVTDAEWVQVRGEYSYSTTSPELSLYLESPDPTVSFLLDDVKITQTAPSPDGPLDQAGLAADFESGTQQGWKARLGSETLAVTDADAHGGTRSLLTSSRTETYAGPAIDLLSRVSKGSRYKFTAWVKLAPGEPAGQLRMSIESRVGETPSYETIVGDTAVTTSGWAQLTGSYILARDVEFLTLYLESSGSTPSFYLDDFTMEYLKPVPIEADLAAVKDAYPADFSIGAAISPVETVGVHSELLAKHFNSVTAGNAMKFDALQPTEGEFRWADADTIANYARDHGLGVRGHTLAWHSQTPGWLFQRADGSDMTGTAEDKALLLSRLETHIRTVVPRYADVTYAWDVVNEVIDEYQADGMRRSKWFTITGYDFIRTAFRVTKEIAPAGTKLCINDYNTEQPRKRDALYQLVKQLKGEGVPVDCVGHQMHVNIERPPISDVEDLLTKFASLGVDQQITELDLSVYTNATDSYTAVPAATLALQGHRYRELFDVFRRHAGDISNVTVWGLADDNTWLKTFPKTRLDLPLLFDEQLQAKPAYWGVVDPSRLPALNRTLPVPSARVFPDSLRGPEWDKLPDTPTATAAGLSAGFQARWLDRKLYLIVDVADSTNDRADAVEIFVDGDNAKSSSYDANDAHYTFQRPGPIKLIRGKTTGVTGVVRQITGGYRVEAAIPMATAGAVGAELGFDVRVKDGRSGGATVSWNDETAGQDTNPARWGTLTLVAELKQVNVPKAARAVVIDGTVDAAWSRAPEITTAVQVAGTAGSAGATGKARLLWADQKLYVLVKVTDPVLDESSQNAYEQDSVEIFVDPDNGKTSGYGDDDGQYRISFTNRQTIGGGFGTDVIAGNLTSAAVRVDGGYLIEAAIALSTITPKEGLLLGFDLQVNDAAGGQRTAATTWQDPTGQSYVNTSRWGVIRLAGR